MNVPRYLVANKVDGPCFTSPGNVAQIFLTLPEKVVSVCDKIYICQAILVSCDNKFSSKNRCNIFLENKVFCRPQI